MACCWVPFFALATFLPYLMDEGLVAEPAKVVDALVAWELAGGLEGARLEVFLGSVVLVVLILGPAESRGSFQPLGPGD